MQNVNQPRHRPAKPAAKALPRRRPRQFRLRFDDAYLTLVLLLVIVTVARLAVAALPTGIAAPGDRLVFGDGVGVPRRVEVTAHRVAGVWAPPGAACVLDVATMSRRPGALTVLAVRPDGAMLSWAGGPTAPAHADCGGDGLVLVAPADYLTLVQSRSPKR